jgi:hypothetical protein
MSLIFEFNELKGAKPFVRAVQERFCLMSRQRWIRIGG